MSCGLVARNRAGAQAVFSALVCGEPDSVAATMGAMPVIVREFTRRPRRARMRRTDAIAATVGFPPVIVRDLKR